MPLANFSIEKAHIWTVEGSIGLFENIPVLGDVLGDLVECSWVTTYFNILLFCYVVVFLDKHAPYFVDLSL